MDIYNFIEFLGRVLDIVSGYITRPCTKEKVKIQSVLFYYLQQVLIKQYSIVYVDLVVNFINLLFIIHFFLQFCKKYKCKILRVFT